MNQEVDYQKSLDKIRDLENELEELQKNIAWMKDSKFWKLRNRLFSLYEKLLGKEYQPGVTFQKSIFQRFLSIKTSINSNTKLYQIWRQKNMPDQEKLKSYKLNIDNLKYQPKISVLMPTYNTPPQLLDKTLESVFKQVYENWEFCIADDCSTNKETIAILKSLKLNSKIKVKYRENNGHISESSNSALELANGEFTLLFDHDDLLTPDALYEIIVVLNQNPDIDIIYSDEDKIENGNFSNPHFKPDWCPDNLLSRNYFGHLVLIRTSLLKEVGGFRKGYEGSQDYDLLLRVTEKTDRIHHIPKILYHWRIHKDSVASNPAAKPYAYDAAVRALGDALTRRNVVGEIKMVHPGFYNIFYKVNGTPKISIIIPAKNKAKLTSTCIDSIFKLTSYPNYEVVLVDNGSDEKEFSEMVKTYSKNEPDRFVHCYYDVPFNFSKLINLGVKQSNGEYIVLLNNDTEVVNGSWLDNLVSNAQRNMVGVVGAKLLFSNSTIQHAGVVIGLGGIAGHSFVGQSRYSTGYFCYPLVISNYSALTAACFMVSKEVFSKVNGFDENLAVEFNDVDFCLKVKELGYNNVYIPYVELYHHESISRGNPLKNEESTRRHIKECVIMKNRWQKYIDNDPCFNPNFSKNRSDFSFSID